MNIPSSPHFLQSLIGLECTLYIFDPIYVIVDVIPPRESPGGDGTRIDVVLYRRDWEIRADEQFSIYKITAVRLTHQSRKILFSRLGKTPTQEE